MRADPEHAIAGLGRDPVVRKIWRFLDGASGFLTGGYLRDAALGHQSRDLDISIEGDVSTVRPMAERLADCMRTRSHLIGRPPRAVFRLETPRLKVELWPLAGRTAEADALRRDLTCNAIQWRLPDGPVFDPTDGIQDLRRKKLRAISRANLDRDPVRLVRICRFAAQLPSFSVHDATSNWLTELANRIVDAPRERLGQELLNLLWSEAPEKGMALLDEYSLLTYSCPTETPDLLFARDHPTVCSRIRHPHTHPVAAAVRCSGDHAALGFLLRTWRVTEPATVAEYAWKSDLRRHALVAATNVESALAACHGSPAERRALIHRTGDSFPSVLTLAAAVAADRGEHAGRWRSWWQMWRRSGPHLISVRPLLKADEVARVAHLSPGPALGRTIAALVNAQVEGRVRSAAGARRWLADHTDTADVRPQSEQERLC